MNNINSNNMDAKKIFILVSPWLLIGLMVVAGVCVGCLAFGGDPVDHLYCFLNGEPYSDIHRGKTPAGVSIVLKIIIASLCLAGIGTLIAGLVLPVVYLYQCYRDQREQRLSVRLRMLEILVLSNFSIVPGFLVLGQRCVIVIFLIAALAQLCYVVCWCCAMIKRLPALLDKQTKES